MKFICFIFLSIFAGYTFAQTKDSTATKKADKPVTANTKPDSLVKKKPVTGKVAPGKFRPQSRPPAASNTPVRPSTYFFENKDRYSNGQLKEKGDTINGLKEGEWTQFDRSGKVTSKVHYVKGVMEGEVEYYYENAQIREKGKILNEKYEGEVTSFYMNGEVYFKRSYSNGIAEGEWTWNFENGKPRKILHYTNGQQNGEASEYFENGQQKIKSNYLNGKLDGEYAKYYPSGQERKTGAYLNGKKNGEWIQYFENGKVDYRQMFEVGLMPSKIKRE